MQNKSNCCFRHFKIVVSRMINLLKIIQLHWNFVFSGEKLFKFVSRHLKENKSIFTGYIDKKIN